MFNWCKGKKCVALALAKERYSTHMIARQVGCNQPTVLRVIKLERETGDAKRKAKSGQKRVTTKSDDQYLKHMVSP